MERRKILIVGAGIGGLALAAYLRQKGMEPVIAEQAPKWKSIGYVITVWPNGMSMLEGIGAAAAVRKKAARIPGFVVNSETGEKLWEISSSGLTEKYGPTLEMERDVVHKALRSVNKKAKLLMGTTVKTLKQSRKGVNVWFSSGEVRRFDAVIGADGIDSQIRNFVMPKAKKDYTGITFWMLWAPKKFRFPKDIHYYVGNKTFFTIFPSRSTRHICVVFAASAKAHNYDSYGTKETVPFLKQRFCGMGGLVPKVLRHLPRQQGEIYHHDDEEVRISSWHNGKVALLGDSVHALSPILGLGASMALEDANVLAEELAANNEVEEAFENYAFRRHSRVDFLAGESRRIHKFLTLGPPFTYLRDFALKKGFMRRYYRDMDKFLAEQI